MRPRTRNIMRSIRRAVSLLILISLLSGCMVNNGVIPTADELTVSESETRVPVTSVPSSEDAASDLSGESSDSSEALPAETTPAPTEPTTERETHWKGPIRGERITIVAVGDMLMHPDVSGLAFKADGSINYDYIFEPVLDETLNADLAIVNNEVPFGGNEIGLRNYPAFNVFTELGDAEAKAGFDVILNATNHVRDMGTRGIERTLEFWKKYPDILTVGAHLDEADYNALHIFEVKGVKIAVFNYVYGVNAGVDVARPYLIDLMTPPYIEKIQAELLRAEREADFTIVCPHWGEEYRLKQTSSQVEFARFFTECGADLIIGTHPHCLEPIKVITSPNGNQSLCYYSLGNYISMQDETISMLGGLAKVTLLIGPDGKPVIDAHELQPIVSHYDQTISWCYNVRLENYTQALVNQHAIKVCNLPGDGARKGSRMNDQYPFSLETLHSIWNYINENSD